MDKHETKKCDIIVSEREEKLIKILRELRYGEATIYVKDGQPYRIGKPLQSILL